jgi:molybdopterin-guanine dinucleotide biosynthesis protein A
MNLVITGEVQSGKTTWGTKYCNWLKERNFIVGGVLCPEVKNNGLRVGYNVVDVRTGQSSVFGRFITDTDFPGVEVGRYRISYDGLEFANRVIIEALDGRCDMIFIDEIGHLELAGHGIAEVARIALHKAANTTTIVRKTLLTEFIECFQLKELKREFVVNDIEQLPGNSYWTPVKHLKQDIISVYNSSL